MTLISTEQCRAVTGGESPATEEQGYNDGNALPYIRPIGPRDLPWPMFPPRVS